MEETAAGAENLERAVQLPGQNRELYLSKLALFNAVVYGDWGQAAGLLNSDPRLVTTDIKGGGETVLHVAIRAKQVHFVERIIKFITPEELVELKDGSGNTPFCIAAAAGYVKIAKILLMRNPNLLEIRGPQDLTPLNMTVLQGQSEMAMFLYDRDSSYLTLDDLTSLFFDSISNDLYDFALKLLEKSPELALTRQDDTDVSALHVLARKPTSIFGQEAKFTPNEESTSSPALQLLNRIWDVAKVDPYIITLINEPSNLLCDAARLGNSHFLSELICSDPRLVYELDEKRRTIFHVAILHRQLSVFDLINLKEIGLIKEMIATYVDDEGNSMLHLAAMLYRYPESALSSTALEMQQELIIFQDVEKLMQPVLREAKNVEGLTAYELFAREHSDLQKNGALWMNNTASLSSVVATLITAITFAAVFTVPGSTDDKTGTPLLLKKTLFHVFAISNAIALSSSSFSILMFLSILTSGYPQSQFLRSLPLKSMIGLLALIISILFMMITFSLAYFLLYHEGSYTIPMLTAVLVSLPITLFVLLQYPLVRDTFRWIRCSQILSRSGFLSKSDK